MTDPTPDDVTALAEMVGQTLREHQPTTGMAVTSGVTCRCGYWSGTEVPGRSRPGGDQGLWWHQAQEISATVAKRDALIRAQALRGVSAEFREAERDGYLYLGDLATQVPWEAVAQRLDSRAARMEAGEAL